MKIAIKLPGFAKNALGQSPGLIVGVLISMGVAASAEYMASQPQQADCAINAAAQKAVNDRIMMIGMTSPDPGKYFNAGSPDSCLGNMSIANLDLSKLIPDPMGLVSGGLDSVIDGLKKAAIGAGCAAVRNSMGDTINKYNSAIGTINGDLNVQGKIDTSIGDAARNTMNGYAMNWTTPQATGVQVSNTPVTLPAISGVTTPSSATQPSPAPAAPSSGGLGSSIFK